MRRTASGRGSETQCTPGQMATHPNKGTYGAEAGQHPRLNRERDLWREGVSVELCVRGKRLTSRLIIVSELDGSGQLMRNRAVRVGYLRMFVRDLCNRTQNTTVIRRSAATVMDVNKGGGIDPARNDRTCQCVYSHREGLDWQL